MAKKAKLSDIERFNTHVNFDGPMHPTQPDMGCCHVWTGCTNPRGYGRFKADRRGQQAHRWRYAFECGPVSADHDVDHTCCNRACVNPQHLQAVSKAAHREAGSNRNRPRKPYPQRGTIPDLERLISVLNLWSMGKPISRIVDETGLSVSYAERIVSALNSDPEMVRSIEMAD